MVHLRRIIFLSVGFLMVPACIHAVSVLIPWCLFSNHEGNLGLRICTSIISGTGLAAIPGCSSLAIGNDARLQSSRRILRAVSLGGFMLGLILTFVIFEALESPSPTHAHGLETFAHWFITIGLSYGVLVFFRANYQLMCLALLALLAVIFLIPDREQS